MPCKNLPMLQPCHKLYEINTSFSLSEVQKIWVFAPINVSYCIYWLIKSQRTRSPFFSQLDPLQIDKCNALTYLHLTLAPQGKVLTRWKCPSFLWSGLVGVASAGGSPVPEGYSWPTLEVWVAQVNEVNKSRSKQEDKRSVGTAKAKPRTWCQKVGSRDKGMDCYPVGGQLPENQTEIKAKD